MKRILYITFLLLLVFFPKNVFAEEEWQITDDGNYYIIDGEKATGIQIINGEKYYFADDGKQVTGFVTIDNKIYFFSRTYGYALKGWVSNDIDGKWYQQEDGSLLTGKQTIDGKTYYFGEDGKLKTGFLTINGKIYFYSRTYGYLLKGWVSNDVDGKWYQRPDGSLATGKQTIDDKEYYFGEDGKLKTGFLTINGKIYFYSRTYGYLLRGWVSNNVDGKWYQQEDGSLLTGKQIIDGKSYYFGEDGKLKTGFLTINGSIYFYSRTYGYLLKGWVSNDVDGKWYQRPDGSLATGRQTIDGKNYYFGEDGILKTGFVEIDGKLYFFSRTYGYALKGIIKNQEGVWFEYEDGEVVLGSGLTEIDGKEYYLDGRNLKSGIIEIEGKNYYFDPKTYEKVTKTVNKKYYDLIINDETGEYIKKQYKPVYYMQKDSRWNKKKYGLGTFGMTGCAPTGMAMAYTSILEKEILPTDVGSYLYYYTDQFNRRLKGTSGLGVIYASNHYNVKVEGIGSKKELKEALEAGKIVYASMQNGKFAKPTYNHVIIMYDYNEEDETTFTLDPLYSYNNDWTNIDLIWREQCMDPDDRTGGYALYSLEEK